MMRQKLFILCITLGLLSTTAADPTILSGIVRDALTSEPIAGVIVKAKGSFTSTDKDGKFNLSPKAVADSISFRFIGYETLTLPKNADMSVVELTPRVTRLNDVIVEAPDIYARGDTLVFNVEKYATAKDNAIIDVIKRLPGIKVENDGTIKYQGKPINKFYLDGNDFISNQYGLATNNISHKDVKSVEVMENHQPVKALEGIEFPEEAGINLKLKDDARLHWVGVAQAATGIQPFLYDGSLFTMRMASKVQNLFTLKADNTGWNPENEIREHNFDNMFSSDYVSSLWIDYISADRINMPLSEKRTRDNLSWLANAITAWKYGDTAMRLKLNYMADRLDYSSGVITDYFSPQIPTFVQNSNLRTQRHNLSAQFNSEINKRGYYLKDKLTLSAEWSNAASAISGSFNIDQLVNRKNFTVSNDLKLVKRNDRKLVSLTSRNTFSYRPDRLCVTGEEDVLQTLSTTDFRSTTETELGKMNRFWKYYLTAGIDLNYHHLNSSLSTINSINHSGNYAANPVSSAANPPNNSGGQNAFLSNIYATPQIDYERSRWRLSFFLPLKWMQYSITGSHNYITTYPHFNTRCQLTSKSDLSASVGYSLGAPQAYLEYTIPILSDYRNLFIASKSYKYSHNIAASATYRYRNPIKSLFTHITLSYNYHQSSIISNQLFITDFIISTFAQHLNHTAIWTLNSGISKGLGHSKMVVGIDLNATQSRASSMRDNLLIPYRQQTIDLKPHFKGSLLRWLSLNYEISYTLSSLTLTQTNTYQTLHQNLYATLLPNDFVQFTFGTDHFFTRFPEGTTANLLLLDTSAIWRINGKIRLALTASNLLNKHTYNYITYGTLSRSEHSFHIRPRTLLATLQYRF